MMAARKHKIYALVTAVFSSLRPALALLNILITEDIRDIIAFTRRVITAVCPAPSLSHLSHSLFLLSHPLFLLSHFLAFLFIFSSSISLHTLLPSLLFAIILLLSLSLPSYSIPPLLPILSYSSRPSFSPSFSSPSSPSHFRPLLLSSILNPAFAL